MRFTEHELTAALTGTAKSMLGVQDRAVRKGQRTEDEAWEAMSRYARFQMLDGIGDQILAALVALPDVEVEPGTRPTFTEQQVAEAVEGSLGDVGRVRRAVLLKARIALVQLALENLPPRQDPDALIVPDHL